MAAAEEYPQTAMSMPTFRPIIDSQAVQQKLSNITFDPDQHLAYKEPGHIIKMTDIGYDENTGISPVAVSEPFRLFTLEAVQKMRDEALSDEVMAKCLRKSNLAACQVRGYASKYAPFIHDAWHNENTLEIISKIAGVDLIPSMDYEIGHINISVKSAEQTKDELAAIRRDSGVLNEDEKPVVGWHTDSYPFVCVTMLSDCTDMVGGETALRTGDGSVMKVRGPEMGCAVVMQGRYITHQALRALGAQERITMVTSFRPKNPNLPDDSVLHTTRGISDLSELYYEFGRYRLEMVEERIRNQIKQLDRAHAVGKKTDTKALKRFLDEQEQFLHHTNSEMVPDDQVVAGEQPELDIPDERVPAPPKEQRLPVLKRAKLA